MSLERFDATGALRQWWDDATRTYHEYDDAGVETLARPYTTEENEYDDARAAEAQLAATEAQLTDTATLATRLTRLAAYKTDVEIVAALARANSTAPTTQELNRLLKVMLRRQARISATLALLVRLIDPALLADTSDTADA